MTKSGANEFLMRAALSAALSTGVLLLADVAYASQGPGGGLGTATPLTQVVMAVVVYGMSGMIVAAGLIGAARGRWRSPNA